MGLGRLYQGVIRSVTGIVLLEMINLAPGKIETVSILPGRTLWPGTSAQILLTITLPILGHFPSTFSATYRFDEV